MKMEIYILSTFLFEAEMLYLSRKYLAENWGLGKEGNNKNRIFLNRQCCKKQFSYVNKLIILKNIFQVGRTHSLKKSVREVEGYLMQIIPN